MKNLEKFGRSRLLLLRIYPTLFQPQTVPGRSITNTSGSSKYEYWSIQKRSVRDNHAKNDAIKYQADLKLHTDGVIKMVISNARELYCDLRDDFKANRGFNVILITVIGSYTATLVGRLFLEYKKDKREEKEMEREYQFKMSGDGMKPNTGLQMIKESPPDNKPSVTTGK